MKKFLLTALLILTLVTVTAVGLLPAMSGNGNAVGMPDAGTLQAAALNAAITGSNATGAPATGVGATGAGATVTVENAITNGFDLSEGKLAMPMAKVEAEEAGYTVIESSEDWATKVVGPGTYVLLADIEVNETKSTDANPAASGTEGTDGYVPADPTRGRWKVVVIGNGHTITASKSLFGSISDAEFYDFKVVAATAGFTATPVYQNMMGVVAQYCRGVKAVNIKNEVDLNTTQSYRMGSFFGATGANTAVILERCWNVGTVITGGQAGGLIGHTASQAIRDYDYNNGGTIIFRNCRNDGVVQAPSWAAGFTTGLRVLDNHAEKDSTVLFENCVNTGNVTASGAHAGGFAISLFNTNDKTTLTPVTQATFRNCINTGDITGGSGGSQAGILVAFSNCGDLNASDDYANIDLVMENVKNEGTVTGRWASGIGPRGLGRSYTYTNVTNAGDVIDLAKTGSPAGFIANIAQVWSVHPNKANYAQVEINMTFTNCVNSGNISTGRPGGYIGLYQMAGIGVTTFTNCVNSGKIGDTVNNSGYNVGGYIGTTNGTTYGQLTKFINCTNSGEIGSTTASSTNVGGFVGQTGDTMPVYFENCLNSGAVYAGTSANSAGGFVGQARSATVGDVYKNCINTGAVTAQWAAGFASQIVRKSGVTFENCTNEGDITSTNGDRAVGGFITRIESLSGSVGTFSFTNCINKGDMVASRPGGFIGLSTGNGSSTNNFTKDGVVNPDQANTFDTLIVRNCTNEGDVTASGSYGGGFAATAWLISDVDGFTNTGAITCNGTLENNAFAGGFYGWNQYLTGHLKNVVNKGVITAPATTGTVTPDGAAGSNASGFGPAAGGIVGCNWGWNAIAFVTNCKNEGAVTGATAGGIIGTNTRYRAFFIEGCVNTGVITSNATEAAPALQGAGGIVGFFAPQYGSNNDTVVGCVNTGAINSTVAAAGGIIGTVANANHLLTVEACVNFADVTGAAATSAGIVGTMTPTVEVYDHDDDEDTAKVPVVSDALAIVGCINDGAAANGVVGDVTASALTVKFNAVRGTVTNAVTGAVTCPEAAYVANYATAATAYDNATQATATTMADGTLLAALNAAAEDEVFETIVGCAAQYDAPAYAAAIAPYKAYADLDTHDFSLIDSDNTHHWAACRCGAADPDQEKEEHDVASTYSYDIVEDEKYHYLACSGCDHKVDYAKCEYQYNSLGATQHNKVCACGDVLADSAEDHVITTQFDADQHWQGCVCGYVQGEKVNHTIDEQKDATHHWTGCDCGYISVAKVEHDFGTAAEFVDDDTHKFTCSDCGYEKVEDHTESAPADCTNAAFCQVCNSDYGDPAGHSYEEENYGSDGTYHWLICDVCDEPDTDHKVLCTVGTNGTAATCQSAAICGTCGHTFGAADPNAHSFTGAWTQIAGQDKHAKKCAYCDALDTANAVNCQGTGANCTTKATCATCNAAYGTVAADVHSFTGAAVQFQVGGVDYHAATCSRCSARDEANKVACSAVGGAAATCTQRGLCGGCEEYFGTVDANNHDFVSGDEYVSANGQHQKKCARCEAPGTAVNCSGGTATCTDKATCSICGAEYGNLLDHTYGDWTTTKEPTETEKGSKEKKCSVCGDKVTEEIAATGKADSKKDGEGLGTGAIIGIVVGAVVVLGGAGVGVFFFLKKKKGVPPSND